MSDIMSRVEVESARLIIYLVRFLFDKNMRLDFISAFS